MEAIGQTRIRPAVWVTRWPLVVAAGLLCGLLATWGVHHARVSLIIVMGLLIPLPAIIRVAQGRWDPFEPIHILALAIGVLFVARPIAELAYGITTYGDYLPRPGFNNALLIGIVGTTSLYIGYFSRWGDRLVDQLRPLPPVWDRRRSVRFVLGLLVVSAMLTLLFMTFIGGPRAFIDLFSGRAGEKTFTTFLLTNAYVYQGPYLVIPASFILLSAFQVKRTIPVALLLLFCIACALGLTVPNGGRTFMLQLIMPLIFLFYLRRGRRPSTIGVILTILFTIAAANIFVATRNVGHREPLGEAIVHAFTQPGDEIKKFLTAADPSEFTVLAIESHQIAEGNLKMHPGATIASITFGPIPRKLIGDKPKSGLEWVTFTLFPATRAARASYGPSFLGDLYADWGFITVIFYCVLIGIATRVIWEYFRRNQANPGIQLVFAAMTPMFVILVRNSLPDILARSIFMTFPVILCVIVCSRPPKGRFGRLASAVTRRPRASA